MEAFLNDHMEDTLLTLENEKMFVESIHRKWSTNSNFCIGTLYREKAVQRCTIQKSYIDIRHLESLG